MGRLIILLFTVVCSVLVEEVRPLTVDEVIRAALPEQYLQSSGPVEEEDGTYLVEMDMRMSKEEYELYHKGVSEHKGLIDVKKRWTNNIIPYQIMNYFSDQDKLAIRKGMDEWEKYTCIKFVPYTNQRNYVRIISANGCWSRVGMEGRRQDLSLQIGSCVYHHTIVHELGHTVGFHHEQTRPDRDQFVTIIRNNVVPGLEYNFDKYDRSIVGDFGVKYDYLSVMHYGQYAFSKNGKTTIKPHDKQYDVIIGTVPGLSFKDIQAANIMYKCDARCTNQCPSKAIREKNCKCWCNNDNPSKPIIEWDRVSTCKGGDDVGDPCKDYHKECPQWAAAGECDNNGQWMSSNCMKSCQVCGDVRACRDFNKRWCPYWAMIGECQRNPGWMNVNCRFSCKVCGTHPKFGECEDRWPMCAKAAQDGECESHSEAMLIECPVSCKACGPGKVCKNWDYRCGFWKEKGKCSSERKTMERQCPQACGFCSGGSLPECRDYAKESNCKWWAATGQCGSNPRWMLRKCPKSCLVCGPDAICQDRDTQCHLWKFQGKCDSDKEYTHLACRHECGLCTGNPADKSGCKNYEHNCDKWVAAGECDANPEGMLFYCPRGCKACGPGTLCKDWLKGCPSLAADGDCKTNPAYMNKHCPKSCKTCCKDPDGCENIGGPKPGLCSSIPDHRCINYEKDCDAKAARGECYSKPEDMLRLCGKACKLCGPDEECNDFKKDCPAWAFTGECKYNPGYMDQNCRKSCRCCENPIDGPRPGQCTTIPDDKCVNYRENCESKANSGECFKDPVEMLRLCRRACRLCGPLKECHDHKEKCAEWAGIGECEKNPSHMHMFCRKSCRCCQKPRIYA